MTLPKEIQEQIEAYLQKRDEHFGVAQELKIRDSVKQFVSERESNLLAEQKLAIREELETLYAKRQAQQRGNIQFILGLVGVSLVSVAIFIWSEMKEAAADAATAAISEPLRAVNDARDALDAASDQFDDIRAKITITQDSALSTRRQVIELLGEVDEALGEARSVQGGIGIANDLSKIYERLERMEFARRSNGPSSSAGSLIEDQFFNDTSQEQQLDQSDAERSQ